MSEKPSVLSPSLSLKRRLTKPATRSAGGIVVSQCRIASEIGARVLCEGGHAVDAAVATAFAIGVVEPWMSGIGGIGAMLVRDAKSGAVTGFDFGAVSPMALNPADYPVVGGTDANLFGWPVVKDNRNTTGAYAMVTPTQPAGLAAAHKKYGTKRWADLLQPAIKLAVDGPVADWFTVLMIANAVGDLRRDPGAAARFLRNGAPPSLPVAINPDSVVRMPAPQLALSLRAIAADGAAAMSTGALARAIAEDVRAMGGGLSADDLAAPRVKEVASLVIPHGAQSIHVLPELNGGPTLAAAFGELARLRPTPAASLSGNGGGATFVAYGRALQHAWADRFTRLGDAGERGAPTCTTHISVVDRAGNMVTLTQTLLSLFGSRVVLPQTGILMNNGINWFDPVPGRPNSIGPGKRALANYAPAILTGSGQAMAIGGSGGRKIIPAVFQALAMAVDFGLDLDAIVHQPRIDVSGEASVGVDRRLDRATLAALDAAFDTVLAEPVAYPFPFTVLSGVRRVGDQNEGATEPEHPWSEAVAEDDV